MTTVIVKDVEKKTNGWFEVQFESGDPASTKSQEVADRAFEVRGDEVEAKINEVTRGKFTNRYLNEIAGVSDGGGPRRASGDGTPRRQQAQGGGRSEETQERIARQWAYGRAVELLIGSGKEFDFPLQGEDLANVAKTAETLLERTR